MEIIKYVIIGNGIAGLSAAREIRNKDSEGSILMITNEPFLTYYRVKLTEYLSKSFNDEDLLVSKESWYEEKNIKVMLNKIVERLDTEESLITLDDSRQIKYEKLLLATGGRPFIPPINGKYKEGVHAIRTLRDLRYSQEYFTDCDEISIIGGGLLGLEAAWSLQLLGKKVNIIEFAPYLLPRQLDREISDLLKEKLIEQGFNIYLNSAVEEILGEGKVEGLKLNDGSIIKTQGVLISAGIRPNLDIVRDTEIIFDKGIIVDKHMKTNIPNIYAAGDVVQIGDMVIGLWTASNEQGKIAGANMTGKALEYKEPKLFTSLQIGDIKLFSAGDILNYDKVYEYKEEDKNIHHKLFSNQGESTGVILFGDIKETNALRTAVMNKVKVEEYLEKGVAFKE